MLRSEAPRGPRGASPNVRGRGGRGGGIQKRRGGAGPIRVDRDGDLVMDAAASADKPRSGKGRLESPKPQGVGQSSGSRGRGTNLVTQRTQQAIIRGLGGKQANIVESRNARGQASLEVRGLRHSKVASNPDRGVASLLTFLERKATDMERKHGNTNSNRTVRIKKSRLDAANDSVIITASLEDIASIQKLDNFQFAGTTLIIKATEASPVQALNGKDSTTPNTEETKERLRNVLASRYVTTDKLLNLAALGQDEGLKAMGVFDGTTTTSKVFPALMVICDGFFKSRQEKSDAILSVSLANNGLPDVSMVSTLAQTFPDLKNLDLSNNAIADLKSLDPWKAKFKALENLLLTGNPIESKLATEKDELMKRYPSLQFLNGIQVRTPEEAVAAIATSKITAMPIPIRGADFRDVAQVGENFARQFFSLYDTDRTALLGAFYDDQSLFSLSANMLAPKDRKVSHYIPAWAPYVKFSRNLTKITNPGPRLHRQFRGANAIKETWTAIPATRHPDLLAESLKYMIECNPLPGLVDPSGQNPGGVDGLILMIQGEFEEPNTNPEKQEERALRSFSRTFVLGPGAPGNPPIRVISDMMVLRAWSPLALPVEQVVQQAVQLTVAPQQAPEQQAQELMTMQLAAKSGMTPQYAIMCLAETGWDLEKAFMAFTANKANLPAEAFTPI